MVHDLVWEVSPLVRPVMVVARRVAVMAKVVKVVRGRGHGRRGKVVVVRLAARHLVGTPRVHLELITVERVWLLLAADHRHILEEELAELGRLVVVGIGLVGGSLGYCFGLLLGPAQGLSAEVHQPGSGVWNTCWGLGQPRRRIAADYHNSFTSDCILIQWMDAPMTSKFDVI